MRHLDNGIEGYRIHHSITVALTIVLLALAQSTAAAPPPGKGKPGSGGGDGGASCSYPAFADVPRTRLERRERKSRYDDFSTAARYEWVRAAIGTSETVALIDNGQLHGSAWTHETMTDPLNRSGNAGIDEDGQRCSDCTPVGKRHSAWYDSSSDLVGPVRAFDVDGDGMVDDGALPMLGAVDDLVDPTRPNVMPSPDEVPWPDIRPRTSWLKTWERGQDSNDSWVREGGLSTLGTNKFKAPLYLEARVNFSRMQTPGFRLSLWLMPATFDGSTFVKSDSSDCANVEDGLLTNGCYSDPTPEFRSEAYDRNWKNGYEMDLFEFEPVGIVTDGDGNDIVCGNAIEFSALNDYIGNRGKDTEYAVKNHFEGFEEGYCDPDQAVDYGELSCDKTYANPAQPTDYLINDDVWHKIGFLWTTEELVWIFNDEIVLEITDPARIPDASVHQYLNLSREMTNGLNAGTIVPNADDITYDVYLPAESGLYGWDGRSNMGDYRGNVQGDEALIHSIKIWDLTELQP